MTIPAGFGLIGIGGFATAHLEVIRKLEKEKENLVRLLAVADPGAARFPDLKSELESAGIHWHPDYQEMLDQEKDLAAVTIATPIPFHYEMALACINRGLFVNLEKPPVPLIQQLETLIRADEKSQVGVGFQMIGFETLQNLKNLAIEGKLGDIREIHVSACWPRRHNYYHRSSWAGKMSLGGEPVFDGPATNALAHLVHNVMFLASPDPDGFDAPVEVTGELYRARPVESYDTICMKGRFRSGISFSMALTHATQDYVPWKIELRGSKGNGLLSNDGTIMESGSGKSELLEDTPRYLEKSYLRFVDYIRGKQHRPLSTLADARGFVLATNGALVSSGGIHSIAPEWINLYSQHDDPGFHVTGLREAVETTFQTGQLFSEQGLPWAVKPQPVSLEDFKEVDFSQYCQEP